MESRADKAAELKRSGKCNCAQAIACTYCDYAGMDEQTLNDLTQAFGFGLGTLEGTCGSIIGAGIVLGAHNKDRRKTVSEMRAIMTEFQKRNGSVTCKTLKGTDTGVVLRECPNCVKDAAEMLEAILDKE